LIGAALSWTLVDAKNVTEIMGLWETFFTDPYILALFPMFFASNWFYAYHFTEVNAAYFNTRTRALNGVVYYIMQIVGAYVFGYALDAKGIRRTTRAKGAWAALFTVIMIVWGCGYKFQTTYDRASSIRAQNNETKKDWTDKGFAGPFVLYMFYGFTDAAWQTSVYW
jgi:hypothetical protein